ncbi:MAG: hypothetical protein ABW221_07695 [Vicinamibacteria bacterium]
MRASALLLAAALAAPAAALAQRTEGFAVGDTGYTARYGTPEHWPLEDLLRGVNPRRDTAIWTQGQLAVHGQTIRLCLEGGLRCLPLDHPVAEIRSDFFDQARLRSGHAARVDGAFLVEGTDVHPRFWFWSFESGEEFERGSTGRRILSIESVVLDPARYTGRAVVVTGEFAGARAEDEAPPRGDAWLLVDGPFYLWVAGRPPRGDGWRLEPSDARRGHRVTVEGRVVRWGERVGVDAERVRLLRRSRE